MKRLYCRFLELNSLALREVITMIRCLAQVMRPSNGVVTIILVLGITLSIVGCARFTYDETPTAAPQAQFLPTATSLPPTVAPAMPTPTLGGPTILRIEPSMLDLEVGGSHLVQIWLDNAEDLHTIELHISFEPGYVCIEDANSDVEGVQISEGVMPKPGQVKQNEVNHEGGLITYRAIKDPEKPGSRSGTVASFTVQALAEGGSPLRFTVVNLLDSKGEPLSAPDQVNGLVIIDAGAGTPQPTGQAVSTQAPPTMSPDSTLVVTTPFPTTETHHTVQPGENLLRIALHYGVTVDAIVAANDLVDPNSVQVGQRLLIPASPPNTYVVQPGDTVYSIARRFNTTAEALAELNEIGSSYVIKVGQALLIAP